jgi:hypothetical protein
MGDDMIDMKNAPSSPVVAMSGEGEDPGYPKGLCLYLDSDTLKKLETSPYAGMASILNHLTFAASPDVQTLTINEGQGIKIDQTFSSAVGTTNIRVVFSVK